MWRTGIWLTDVRKVHPQVVHSVNVNTIPKRDHKMQLRPLAVFLLAISALFSGEDGATPFVIQWDKYRTYITPSSESLRTKVATYEKENLAIFYAAEITKRKATNSVNITAVGAVVWGPKSTEWLPDSFYLVPAEKTGLAHDELHVVQDIKIIPQKEWTAADQNRLKALEGGIPLLKD